VFQAIACPTRRALLDALALGERTVSDLVGSVGLSQSAVSQQLSVLKSARLVEERAQGRFRFYSLQAAPLAEVGDWIARHRAAMERQLDALGSVLDAMTETSPRSRSRRVRKGRT
jgi:DNA-binding transcriptional ArsR family regulator